jgi:signal transduction histidine kinase
LVRASAPSLPSDLDASDDTDELDMAPPSRLAAVPFAQPRRRLSTGSHAEFVGALVHEFRGSLASLKGASELMARRRHDLDDAVLADLTAVIDRQAARVAWLVRLLEAVDGDGSSRRVEAVHGPTVTRQAAAAIAMVLEMAPGADRDGDVFPGDPERVRLGLEILFEALCSPAGAPCARMPVAGFLTVVAPTLDLDEQQRRFALRSAFRVLDMEGCQLRVRSVGDETRAEVRLGPRKK